MSDLESALRDAQQAMQDGEQETAVRWLRISSVCRRLDVRKSTVYAWIEEGVFADHELTRLPNSHWRIRESAIEALERRGRPRSVA